MSVLVCNRKFCEASVYAEITKLWNSIEKDISECKESKKYALAGISEERMILYENSLNCDFRKMLMHVSIAKNIPITSKTKREILEFKIQNIFSAIGYIDVIFADIEHIVFLHPKSINRIDHYKLIELGKIKDLLFKWKNNTLNKIKNDLKEENVD